MVSMVLLEKETANPRKSRSLRSLRKSRLLFVALIPPDSGGLVAIATAPANAGRRQSGAVLWMRADFIHIPVTEKQPPNNKIS
ncbi:hypothetical protein McpSp1_14670 [Methanocorpusculaceae archaeon Sp1]|nr:hypothetical protein [Methanocorpusculaceae archaeon Sp1]